MNLSTTGLTLAPDAAIDLQLHTIYSDGSWTVEVLFDYLMREQFGLVAITDHDCVDTAVPIQQRALEKQLPVLVAVEMSTSWQGKLIDLLCFGFNLHHSPLNDLAQDLMRRQQENIKEMVANLEQQGFTFSSDTLPTILAKPSVQQTNALASLLKEHGYGQDRASIGKLLRDAGYKLITNDPADVVEATHKSGGVCLLAHPGRTDGFMTFDAQSLDEFCQIAPIDGLEAYYPLHTPAQTTLYKEYAQQHNMLISAGSDSHTPEKPPVKYLLNYAEPCWNG
ncbi:PHP domain-containing protein [Candidatus Leptofilum sp.]|uniref:PHP domain-containing protein n=1 Tax=Candidatus Leptofilum sp. TaxID=3241576 RepID=UPI003B59A8A2